MLIARAVIFFVLVVLFWVALATALSADPTDSCLDDSLKGVHVLLWLPVLMSLLGCCGQAGRAVAKLHRLEADQASGAAEASAMRSRGRRRGFIDEGGSSEVDDMAAMEAADKEQDEKDDLKAAFQAWCESETR